MVQATDCLFSMEASHVKRAVFTCSGVPIAPQPSLLNLLFALLQRKMSRPTRKWSGNGELYGPSTNMPRTASDMYDVVMECSAALVLES